MKEEIEQGRVHILSPEVARKIAAGEVIERPSSIIRELLDNAVDSGAKNIQVEIKSGGIDSIRIVDDGCGMTKEDLKTCAHPHATSKISTETDLLNLSTLGFRGEALSSIAAVSRLQITSGQWTMKASITEDHIISPCTPVKGTIVSSEGLFENFPARRMFLKRPASEGIACRQIFIEKALPRPDISFKFTADGKEKDILPACDSLKSRILKACGIFENENAFYEISAKSDNKDDWSFKLIIGNPDVNRDTKKNISIYVNGRKIQEYSLVQAIEYGCQGFFPNGSHPVAYLFVEMNPSLVDFNIHPAKREVRFRDSSSLHHGISSSIKDFFRQYTIKNMIEDSKTESSLDLYTEKREEELPPSYSEEKQINDKIIDDIITFEEKATTEKKDISYSYEKNIEKPTSEAFLTTKEKTPSYEISRNTYSQKPSRLPHVIPSVTSSYLSHIANKSFDNETEKVKTSNDEDFKYLGSTLGVFLLVEKNNTLYIIDQHAAHERIIFNKILADSGKMQYLLLPYVIETNSDEDDKYMASISEELQKAGFTVKNCGKGKWEFTTVPLRWKGKEKDLYNDLLEKHIEPKDILYHTAASSACRAAVMDGHILDRETASEIAKKALELPDPHCPHGRPIFYKLSKKDLFMAVKRIQ
ncbi:MAG: DNA mismatch repair endonuclease MutL [Treponema sp.]|nr:DNA mismatch repair endonuclease MutL [Treponema sp.]